MAVEAIQLNKHESKRMSYIQSGLIGAAGGYALKQFLPVTRVEKQVKKDEFFSEFKNNVKRAKTKQIEAIRNSAEKTVAQDSFIKMIDGAKTKSDKLKFLKSLDASVAKEVKNIISIVNNGAKEVKLFNEKILTGVVKQIRPTKTFVATGASFTLATAFVYNILRKISEERSKEQD